MAGGYPLCILVTDHYSCIRIGITSFLYNLTIFFIIWGCSITRLVRSPPELYQGKRLIRVQILAAPLFLLWLALPSAAGIED